MFNLKDLIATCVESNLTHRIYSVTDNQTGQVYLVKIRDGEMPSYRSKLVVRRMQLSDCESAMEVEKDFFEWL